MLSEVVRQREFIWIRSVCFYVSSSKRYETDVMKKLAGDTVPS